MSEDWPHVGVTGDVPIDYVTAHKWFNLAAMHGNNDAVRLRREINVPTS